MNTLTPKPHDTPLVTSESNSLPSVNVIHFDRKNDPLAGGGLIPGEGCTVTGEGRRTKAGDEYLVNNSSYQETCRNLGWDMDGFGDLANAAHQDMFDSLERVLQMRFDQIYQRWLSHFPQKDGNSSAVLFECLKNVEFTKKIGTVTSEELEQLRGQLPTGIPGRASILLDAGTPAQILLQVLPCYCTFPGEQVKVVVIFQIGLNLLFQRPESNDTRTVAISCGVYLEDTSVVEDAERRECEDLSSLISFPQDAITLQNTSLESEIEFVIPNRSTDPAASSVLQSGLFKTASSLLDMPENLSLARLSSDAETNNPGHHGAASRAFSQSLAGA